MRIVELSVDTLDRQIERIARGLIEQEINRGRHRTRNRGTIGQISKGVDLIIGAARGTDGQQIAQPRRVFDRRRAGRTDSADELRVPEGHRAGEARQEARRHIHAHRPATALLRHFIGKAATQLTTQALRGARHVAGGCIASHARHIDDARKAGNRHIVERPVGPTLPEA